MTDGNGWRTNRKIHLFNGLHSGFFSRFPFALVVCSHFLNTSHRFRLHLNDGCVWKYRRVNRTRIFNFHANLPRFNSNSNFFVFIAHYYCVHALYTNSAPSVAHTHTHGEQNLSISSCLLTIFVSSRRGTRLCGWFAWIKQFVLSKQNKHTDWGF